MKKILSILLAMLMLVSVLLVAPVSVGAAESTPITVYFENNWLWSDVFYHTWGSSYYPDTEWEKGEVKLVGTSVNGHEVYAQHLDDPYTAASDCVSVDYSALSYAYLAQQSSNPDLVNLANALAAYHRAACDYIGL